MMRTHSQEMWKRVCSLQGQQSGLENEEASVKKTCANLGSASRVKNSDCDCEGLCIYPLSNRSLTLKLLLKSNAPIGFPWRICVLCLLARAYLPSLVVVWYPHVCPQTPQTILYSKNVGEKWRKYHRYMKEIHFHFPVNLVRAGSRRLAALVDNGG